MKKLLLLIFVLCLFKVSFSQTYPSKQIIGTTQTLVVDTGGMRIKGVFMLGHFVDTVAANAVLYVKNYPYGLITTDTNSVWLRSYDAKKWLQIFLSGSSSDTLTWKLGGNDFTDLSGYATLGSISNDPIYFMTNNLKRLGIPETGILRSASAFNKCLTFDTATKLMYYGDCSGGGGGGGFGRIGLIDSLGHFSNGASTDGNSLFMQTATESSPGLLSAEDKAKIDSLNNIYWYAITKTGYLPTAYRPNDSTIYAKALSLSMPAEFTVTPSYNDTTGTWNVTWSGAAGGGPYWGLTGNAGTVQNTNFIGTTDSNSLVFKINGVQSGKLEIENKNTSYGYSSLLNVTSTGLRNTANGAYSLYSLTTGDYNVGLGYRTMYHSTNAVRNVAIGYMSSDSTTSGQDNVAVGYQSLYFNKDGTGNTAIGSSSLRGNTGSFNTAIGYASLSGNNTAYYNTAIGYGSLSGNTSGTYNTANGYGSLAANTTGTYNTAIGVSAMNGNTTGNINTAVGYFALQSNTTGGLNTALGVNALLSNTTGIKNTAVGSGALEDLTTGNQNSMVGQDAGLNITTGNYNNGHGWDVLRALRTGSFNDAYGFDAGDTLSTGSYNVFLGAYSGANVLQKTDAVKSMALGAYAYNTRDSQIVVGADYIKETFLRGNVGVGTETPTAQLHTTGTVRFAGLSNSAAQYVVHMDANGNLSYADTTAGGGGMTYPGAGIANSTGSAWGTSYTTTGSGTVLALATSPTLVTPLLGTPTSGVLTNTTGYKLSSLSPATTGNSIDNNGNGQVWNFTGLAGTDALKLSSTSTAAASNASTVLNITTDGTNATSSQTTYGAQILNNHIGTSATSIGLLVTAKEAETVYALKAVATNGGLGDPATSIAGYFSASGGTSQNSAIIVPASGGNVGIGTSSPGASSLHIVSAPTNGEGVLASTSTLTSGTLMSLVGTSTVLAANNEVLNISSSGANGTNAITATGARISVTNTNGTSGTNVGLDITASGATTANIAIQAVGHLTFEGVTSTGATGTQKLVFGTSPDFTTGITIGSVAVPTISSTNTFTNKRITSRYGSTTSSATPTINTDNVDVYELTAQAADITSFTTNLSGTPTTDQTLHIIIVGTAARAITWGSSFEASTVSLPTTTVSTNRLDCYFVWNATTNKWRIGGTW